MSWHWPSSILWQREQLSHTAELYKRHSWTHGGVQINQRSTFFFLLVIFLFAQYRLRFSIVLFSTITIPVLVILGTLKKQTNQYADSTTKKIGPTKPTHAFFRSFHFLPFISPKTSYTHNHLQLLLVSINSYTQTIRYDARMLLSRENYKNG